MMANLVKNSKREELFKNIQQSVKDSGLFSEEGVQYFMRSLHHADALMDVDIITMFLFRDGMKHHSFNVIDGFIRQLPLGELRAAVA